MKFKSERANRSDRYQYQLMERSVSFEFFDVLSCGKGKQDSQEFLELKDLLTLKVIALAERELSERQWQVLSLSLQGMTQVEIAAELGVNQSSITKSLSGNVDYSRTNKDGKNPQFGGSIKKLKLIVSKNQEIQDILQEMEDIND